MCKLPAMLVATALLLVGAAPASAVTGGFGVAKSLRGLPAPITFAQASSKAKKHQICEATGSGAVKSKQSSLMNELEKRFTPVACEQPPRSTGLTQDQLKAAQAAALAVLG